MNFNEKLISHGDRIFAALSGGADSVCLLLCLLEIKEKFALSLSAVHCNHHLREESNDDMRFCEGLCARLGVPLITRHLDVVSYSKENGKSIEESARELRYAAFEECCNGAVVATAHTLSDNMETFLLNLIRGTALTGLCGIPERRGNIIRPLLEATRAEVEEFLRGRGEGFVIDKTNLSTDFTRNKIRLEILPKMTEINPSLSSNFGNTIQALKKDSNFLETVTKEAYDRCSVDTGLGGAALLGEAEAVRGRVLALFLKERGFSPNAKLLRRISAVIESGGGKINLSKDVYLVCKMGIITIIEQRETPDFSAPITLGSQDFLGRGVETVLHDLSKTSEKEIIHRKFAENREKSLKSFLDYGKIQGNVVVRNIRSGDKIRFCGRGFTTSIKKLFSENVPASERGRVLILADEGGAIFVEGFGVSERVALDDMSLRVLEIIIREIEVNL